MEMQDQMKFPLLFKHRKSRSIVLPAKEGRADKVLEQKNFTTFVKSELMLWKFLVSNLCILLGVSLMSLGINI